MGHLRADISALGEGDAGGGESSSIWMEVSKAPHPRSEKRSIVMVHVVLCVYIVPSRISTLNSRLSTVNPHSSTSNSQFSVLQSLIYVYGLYNLNNGRLVAKRTHVAHVPPGLDSLSNDR